MGPLKNLKHEQFALMVADGISASEAYIAIGYTANRFNASRLRTSENVKARIEEIQRLKAMKSERVIEKAVQISGITKAMVINELAKMGFANMLDYVRMTADGDPCVDLSAMTRDQAAAVSEVVVEDYKEGRGDDARDVRRIRFKLHDKQSALISIGKELGMFVDRKEIGGPGDFERMSDDELRELIATRIAGDGPSPVDAPDEGGRPEMRKGFSRLH